MDTPSFVDSHIHRAFDGERGDESLKRLEGADYEEVLAAGGGVQPMVRSTSLSSFPNFVHSTVTRLERMKAYGTTTVEVKYGYGLDVETEVRQLEAIRQAGKIAGIYIVSTFPGAHVVLSDRDRDAYLAKTAGSMLDARCSMPYPTRRVLRCLLGPKSVFCRRVKRDSGFCVKRGTSIAPLRNQFGPTGGVDLVIEIGAVSADNLTHLTDDQIAALGDSRTVVTSFTAVLLSGRIPQLRGVDIWIAGAAMVLVTDCNPGTSYVEHMQMVMAMAMAVREMRLAITQAVWSPNRRGATALALENRERIGVGTVVAG